MVRELLLTVFRFCVVVLPLIAIHRYVLTPDPGYVNEANGSYQHIHLERDASWAYSSEWHTKAAKVEIARVRKELDKVLVQLEASRLVDVAAPPPPLLPPPYPVRRSARPPEQLGDDD